MPGAAHKECPRGSIRTGDHAYEAIQGFLAILRPSFDGSRHSWRIADFDEFLSIFGAA
jgi:hypothetical protein